MKIWHDLGELANLVPSAVDLLRCSACPLVQSQRMPAENGQLSFSLELKRNTVVYFVLSAVSPGCDFGYEYDRI